MSLRLHLNLSITLILLVAMVIAAALVVQNARRAVYDELLSVTALAHEMLQLVVASTEFDDIEQGLDRLRRRLAGMDKARHLRLGWSHGDADNAPLQPARRAPAAPAWFVHWVQPEPIRLSVPIAVAAGVPIRILVQADPADEIDEAWRETLDLLLLLWLFALGAIVLVYFGLGRALRSIGTIVDALDRVERGDYRQRLPRLRARELDLIAAKVNRMAEVLERSRGEARHLARHSLAIQEEERRHLSRELHDELGQCLTAIRADAVAITRASRESAVVTSANAIHALAGEIYDVVRNIMCRLRPIALDELGLQAALRQTVDDWSARHPDVECVLACSDRAAGLGEPGASQLYRIVQEALANISRHARAARVDVELSDGPDGCLLRIADDGDGFDLNAPAAGFGLLGMRERARALRGEFSCVSRPGRGTTIAVSVPTAAPARGDINRHPHYARGATGQRPSR